MLTPAALTTSPYTFSTPLCQELVPWFRRFVVSTGWVGLRCGLGRFMGCGPVAVQILVVAYGACGQVLGMVADMALRVRLVGCSIVCMRLWAPPCGPWELEGRHGFEFGGWEGRPQVMLQH